MISDVLSRLGRDRSIRVRVCTRCLNILKTDIVDYILNYYPIIEIENIFFFTALRLQHFLFNIFTAVFF